MVGTPQLSSSGRPVLMLQSSPAQRLQPREVGLVVLFLAKRGHNALPSPRSGAPFGSPSHPQEPFPKSQRQAKGLSNPWVWARHGELKPNSLFPGTKMFATGNHLGEGILLRKSKSANTAPTHLLFGECLQLSNPRLISLHNTQASQPPLSCSYWNVWGLSHHVLDGAAYLCCCPAESFYFPWAHLSRPLWRGRCGG